MGTVQSHESKASATIAEKYQFLTQNFDRLRNIFQILGARNCQPVASKHFAAGGAGTNMTNYRKVQLALGFVRHDRSPDVYLFASLNFFQQRKIVHLFHELTG